MKTEIYLIRHAKPFKYNVDFENVDESDQITNEKQVLSIEGEKQANFLSSHNELQKIDLVISSNYVRAVSTAKYILSKNNCKFIIDANLGERKIGTEDKPKEFWLEQMLNKNAKCIDGESQLDVRKRMLSVIDNVLNKYRGKRIALVTHAAAMTFLLLQWCDLVDVKLEGKKRKISFKGKVIIDGSFNTPEIFKLTFNDYNLISIERIIVEGGE